MGVAPINREHTRWKLEDTVTENSAMCSFCLTQIENEIHILRCQKYVDLCDCKSLEQHVLHNDTDIPSLIMGMQPETC